MPADPVDALALDVSREALAGREVGRCLVLDDVTGALTQGCLELGASTVTLVCDSLLDERDALAALDPADRVRVTVAAATDAAAFAGVDLVVWRLPRAVDAVEATGAQVAVGADPSVVVVGAARVKHLAPTMNAALSRSFDRVHASLGRQKSRALVAQAPRAGVEPPAMAVADRPEFGFAVHAEAGVFAGSRVDAGTRLLLSSAGRWPRADVVVDLGCGTGLLATVAARTLAPERVVAVDVSAAACRSAAATAAGAGTGDLVRTVRTDDLALLGAVDLVLCNPPFHRGAAKDSGLAEAMITQAAAALRPGGELWLVWNSHLPYRSILRREIGPTDVVVQDRGYTVTRSTRRPATH